MADEKIVTNELQAGIPIEWNLPESLITPFATNTVVQAGDNVVKIFFFQVKPPLRIDKSEPPPSKVRADCVASVIMTPDKLPKIIKILQDQYDKYITKQQVV